MKKEQTGFDGTTDSDTTRREGSGEQTDEHATGVGNRRQFLLGVGAATAFLAGCVGGDDDGNGSDNGNDNTGNGGDDSTGNGGDDNTGNGGDDSTGSGGDDSTGSGGDDSTGSGGDNTGSGGDDSTGSGGDDSAGNGGDDSPGNGGDDSTGNGGDDGTASEEFFNTVNWSSDFRVVFNNEERGTTIEYRRNGGERYIAGEDTEGNNYEYYLLDDATYIVNQGQCITYENPPDQTPDDPTEFENIEDLEAQQPDITQVGTDTVDGDPVTVYEVDGETTYTMYVLESGFPRRIETPQGDSNYYDWGDTEPIEPPDLECMSPGGGGGDGGNGGGGGDGGGYP
jgi:hypothetical protein